MFNIGTQELLIILLMALLLFGAKRVPEVARSFGKGLHDFRDAISGLEREFKDEAMGLPGRPKTPVVRPAAGATPRPATRVDERVAPITPSDASPAAAIDSAPAKSAEESAAGQDG
ncbi:MAG: twin-arginine translocase TatA/TatE family subunit [Candidatus Eisenbacteria bacterium]